MTTERAIQVLNAYQAWRHFGTDKNFLTRDTWGRRYPTPARWTKPSRRRWTHSRNGRQGNRFFNF